MNTRSNLKFIIMVEELQFWRLEELARVEFLE